MGIPQSQLPIASTFASGDWVLGLVDVAGVKTASRVPKSLLPAGATVPTTKLPLKGDNTGNAAAQAIQLVANVASATIAAGTDVVVFTATLTAPCVLTLPALSGMPPGHRIEIRDPGGFVSSTNTVAIARAGTDTINGATSNVVILNGPRGTVFVTAANALTDWGFSPTNIAVTNLPVKGDNGGKVIPLGIFTVGDANATIPAGTNIVYFTAALTAPRTLTLPAASGYTVGDSILFLDPGGFVGVVNNVLAIRAGSDTLNGGTTSIVILTGPRAFAEISLGSSAAWGSIGQIATQARSVVGVVDASSAAAGVVGEVISSQIAVGSAVALTTAVAANITSISLTAGDWDVFACVEFNPGATTNQTWYQGGISITSATLSVADDYFFVPGIGVWAFNFAQATPAKRINVSSTTTVYLVAAAGFTVSTQKAFGQIIARRRR